METITFQAADEFVQAVNKIKALNEAKSATLEKQNTLPWEQRLPAFSVDVKELKKALKVVSGSVNKKTSLFATEHVLLELREDLTLTTTKLDRSSQTRIPAKVLTEGRCLILFKQLNELCKSLKTGIIEFTCDASACTVKTAFSSKKITTMVPEGFPVVEFPMEATFGEDIDFTPVMDQLYCVSKEEYRPAMTGVLFSGKQVVTTDGYRVVYRDFETLGTAIIPAEIFPALKGSTWNVFLNKTPSLVFSSGYTLHFIRAIDEKYPNFENVIPKDNNRVIEFERDEFLEALIQCKTTTNIVSPQVVLSIYPDKTILSSEDKETGNKTVVNIWSQPGPDFFAGGEEKKYVTNDEGEKVEAETIQLPDLTEFQVGFNIQYITELVKFAPKVLVCRFSTPTRAMLADPGMLLMPMRIS